MILKDENKVICGDCLEVMKRLPENSIDTIITDPPYNLSTVNRFKAKDSGEKWNVKSGMFHRSSKGFMGKTWDGTQIAFKKETWEECLRVAKPGATLMAFGGTRTYHRMACAVEDAGWVLKDCIIWLYGSGFPKATDISKQLDKGYKRKVVGYDVNSAPDLRDVGAKSKEAIGIDKLSFGQVQNAKRKIVEITSPTTPEAQLWSGWKSHGLKPSYEPIIVAMKPNEGSYAANALKHGVSGLNIDGSRISTDDNLNGDAYSGGQRCEGDWKDKSGFKNDNLTGEYQQPTGRFPANVILDVEAAKMLDAQSGINKSSGGRIGKKDVSNINFGLDGKYQKGDPGFGDVGGASRFFYCAKASKAERSAGCEELVRKQTVGGGGGIGNYQDDVNSCSGKYGSEKAPAKNYHPTVKPLKLIEYLCTLTKTPTGGIVLDPFAGSCTTALACIKTRRSFLMIEKEEEYCVIGRARIKNEPKTLI